MTNVPTEIATLAAQNELGGVKGVFPAAKKRMLLLSSGIFAVLFGGIAVLIDIVSIASANAAPVGALIVLNALGLPAIGWFAWTLFKSPVVSKKARERKVYWFEGGYIQVTSRGPVVVKWTDIVVVYANVLKLKVGLQHHYRLTLTGGRKSVLNDNVVEMADFGPALVHAVTLAQLPRAMAVLEQGKPVDFGPVVLTSQGVAVKAKAEIPWTDLAGIELSGPHVIVSRAGKAFSQVLLAEKIPNLGTMLELARARVGVRT